MIAGDPITSVVNGVYFVIACSNVFVIGERKHCVTSLAGQMFVGVRNIWSL